MRRPSATIQEKLKHFVSSVPDYRRTKKGNFKHKLEDILLLLIYAQLSSCKTRIEVIDFGNRHLVKFRKMGLSQNGIPSEPTLYRIEKKIDPKAMEQKMEELVSLLLKDVSKSNCTEVVSIDGKAMRETVQENGRNPDIVSAYSQDSKVTLATEPCDVKSNEIKAIPKLLSKLKLAEGSIVTIDAIGCQKTIIDELRKLKYHFVIEIKANQKILRYSIEDKAKLVKQLETFDKKETLEHGRIEKRIVRTYNGEDLGIDVEKWGNKLTVIEVVSKETKKSTGEVTEGQRFYVTDLAYSAKEFGQIVRGHWGIESMHWSLDYNLKQDCIIRKHLSSACNRNIIQRIVLSVLSTWRNIRKKLSDKDKGYAELLRMIRGSFTQLKRFLAQK